MHLRRGREGLAGQLRLEGLEGLVGQRLLLGRPGLGDRYMRSS